METVDSLKAEILRLEKELSEKDKLIAALESQITTKNGKGGISDESDESSVQLPLNPPKRTAETLVPGNLRSSNGAIKALPRELSIFNSESDDVTKYSIDDCKLVTLEKTEMRDAYNARGLYTGQVNRKEQLPDGKGKMEYHNQGRSYEGDWRLGHWHGEGKSKNSFGDIYKGEYHNDLKHGDGRLEYADGRVFEGYFKADDAIKGTLTFPDGAKYVGELHNGTRHGNGIYYFLDGSRYEGESVNNFFEGQGKMVWPDGGFYFGEWQRGEIDGYGMEIRADGSIRHKGLWKSGLPVRK